MLESLGESDLSLGGGVESVRRDDSLISVATDSAAVTALDISLISHISHSSLLTLLWRPAALVSFDQVDDEEGEDEDGDSSTHHNGYEYLLTDCCVNHHQLH